MRKIATNKTWKAFAYAAQLIIINLNIVIWRNIIAIQIHFGFYGFAHFIIQIDECNRIDTQSKSF